MVRGIGAAVLFVMLSGFLPGAAQAHSRLKTSIPAAGATVATGPGEVRLQFDETVEPRFSKISIEAKGGKAVTSEPATSDPSDKTTLIVKFAEPLQAGRQLQGQLAGRLGRHTQGQGAASPSRFAPRAEWNCSGHLLSSGGYMSDHCWSCSMQLYSTSMMGRSPAMPGPRLGWRGRPF